MAVTMYDPIKICGFEAKNRIFMSPLTRMRSPERVPTEMAIEYYRQRASAGLIIAEATQVSPKAVGYPATPGMHSEEQLAGWKRITDAVHAAGGRILAQLWHCGRISHPSLLDGDTPLSASAIKPEGMVRVLRPQQPYVTPKEASKEEIDQVVKDFEHAAAVAKQAGFDGIDIHSANGYFIDQFLQDSTNKRTDEYGGSIENRCRLLWRVFDACVKGFGGDSQKVGVHIAPLCDVHEMGDSDPEKLFSTIIKTARQKKAGFIFCRMARSAQDTMGKTLRAAHEADPDTPFIMNQGITREEGERLIAEGHADACAFGIPFISNPDLPRRFQTKAPLNPGDESTFYLGGEKGYTDYPSLDDLDHQN